MPHRIATLLAAALLAGCASVPRPVATLPELAQAPAPRQAPCPKEAPAGATCYTGEDSLGSYYWIAIPANWNRGVLVMHAHDGPADTGPSRPARSLEDLERWAVTVKAGYAWAPADSKLTRAEFAARVDECTGVRKPEAQRTAQQRASLAAIVDTVHIPPSSLVGHLNFATWLFRDITQLRMAGRNPFGNVGAQYRGSADDTALNAGVPRYARDPLAAQELARDSAPAGSLAIPVLTFHAIHDSTSFVELESIAGDW